MLVNASPVSQEWDVNYKYVYVYIQTHVNVTQIYRAPLESASIWTASGGLVASDYVTSWSARSSHRPLPSLDESLEFPARPDSSIRH